MNIYVLQTGSTLVSSAVPDRRTHRWPLAYTDLFQKRSDRIILPVKAFLIESGGHRVLVDTGWSAECAVDPVRYLGTGLWFASEPYMTEKEAVPAQLSKMGLRPEDIDAVVLTHLDCDHVSGLIPLKNAKHIYCSREEWAHARRGMDPRYRSAFWKGVDIELLDMKDDPKAPFGKSCDLFGDGIFRVVLTPGHTEGSVAVLAQGDTGYAAFVGDDAYNKRSWKQQRLPGPVYNKEDMKKTLHWVLRLSKDPKCTGIYAAHDTYGPRGGTEL